MENELLNLIVLLTSSLLFGYIANFLNLPVIAGQLIAGIIVGPSFLRMAHADNITAFVAELGVMILMFLVGMETNIKQLSKNMKVSIWVAILGVIFPFLMFFFVMFQSNGSLVDSIFFGLIFSATSISITAGVLSEYDYLKTKVGSIVLGAAIIDDILVILLISFFNSIFASKGNFDFFGIIIQILLMIIFFVAMYFYSKYMVPFMFNFVEKNHLSNVVPMISMLVVLISFYVAEIFGISGIVGSFFAGLAVSGKKQVSDLIKEFEPVGYALFIPVFFASIGLGIKLDNLNEKIFYIILLSIVAIISKWLGSFIAMKAFKNSFQESNIVGNSMISRGEMALILASSGLGIFINNEQYSEIAIVILVTTLISPILLRISLKRNKK